MLESQERFRGFIARPRALKAKGVSKQPISHFNVQQ